MSTNIQTDPFTHQDFGFPHFFLNVTDAALLAIFYSEVTRAAGDLKEEVAQHLHASLRQVHLRVELCPVQLLLLIGYSCWGKRQTWRLRSLWPVTSTGSTGTSEVWKENLLLTSDDDPWLGHHFEAIGHFIHTVSVGQQDQLLLLETSVDVNTQMRQT